jgi:hypothetical protein
MTAAHRPAVPPPPDELGVVVHGPVLLARSPGIAAGLRCVFAHPTGLRLLLVLHAEGVQAEAASRRTEDLQPPEHDPWSGITVRAQLDGVEGPAHRAGGRSTGSADDFDLQADFWIGALPGDGRLGLTVGWPGAGLAEAGSVLELAGLGDLASRVVRLR